MMRPGNSRNFMTSLDKLLHINLVFIFALITFRSKSRTPIKIPQATDDESPRQGKRSRASRKNSVSGRSSTEGDSVSASDDDDDTTIFGSVDDGDTTTETDWSASKKPGESRSTTRKTHYSSSVNSRVSSIPTPRSTVSTRQSRNKNLGRAPSESSFVMSRRNSYSDPSGRETRNRSRMSRDGSTVSNRNNSRWSKHSEGGYSISSRQGTSRKAWDQDESSSPEKTSRGKMSRQNTQNKMKPRSRLQSRDSSRNVANNRKSRPNTESKIVEPTKRKRVPKKKERPVLKRADTRGSSTSRANMKSRGGRKQAWGSQGRGQGLRMNTRPVLSRNASFASVSSVASVYSKQQKKMMENIYKMAFDAGMARGMSVSRASERSKSKSRRSSVSSYMSEDDDDYPSVPASGSSSRRNSVADSVHLSSVRDSEGKFMRQVLLHFYVMQFLPEKHDMKLFISQLY